MQPIAQALMTPKVGSDELVVGLSPVSKGDGVTLIAFLSPHNYLRKEHIFSV